MLQPQGTFPMELTRSHDSCGHRAQLCFVCTCVHDRLRPHARKKPGQYVLFVSASISDPSAADLLLNPVAPASDPHPSTTQGDAIRPKSAPPAYVSTHAANDLITVHVIRGPLRLGAREPLAGRAEPTANRTDSGSAGSLSQEQMRRTPG